MVDVRYPRLRLCSEVLVGERGIVVHEDDEGGSSALANNPFTCTHFGDIDVRLSIASRETIRAARCLRVRRICPFRDAACKHLDEAG